MIAMNTASAARGNWPWILRVLGVDHGFLRNEHGPCPICEGKDRYRFDDKQNGSFYCSKCGPGDGFELLMRFHGWNFGQAAAEVDRVLGNCPNRTTTTPERSADDMRNAIRSILSASQKVEPGTAAWCYLNARCGDPRASLGDLWAHPGLWHRESGQKPPALVAVMRDKNGEQVGIHRTWVTVEGEKAPVDPVRKGMKASKIPGACVRLGEAGHRLGIAEGIETAICAGKLFGLPVWAATSAQLMEAWEPPPGVQEVVIFGDNDASFTGQKAAFTLAFRLRSKGLAVSVEIPPAVDTDWNDRYPEVA